MGYSPWGHKESDMAKPSTASNLKTLLDNLTSCPATFLLLHSASDRPVVLLFSDQSCFCLKALALVVPSG